MLTGTCIRRSDGVVCVRTGVGLQVISPEIAAGLEPFGRTEGLPSPDRPGKRRVQPKYQTRGILPGVGGAVYGNFDIIFGPFSRALLQLSTPRNTHRVL